jgi:hypothetical protein
MWLRHRLVGGLLHGAFLSIGGNYSVATDRVKDLHAGCESDVTADPRP